MARPGKGFFLRKSEASTNQEGSEARPENGSDRNRTGESIQETLQTTDLVRKGLSILECGSVYPIVEESLIFYQIPQFQLGKPTRRTWLDRDTRPVLGTI